MTDWREKLGRVADKAYHQVDMSADHDVLMEHVALAVERAARERWAEKMEAEATRIDGERQKLAEMHAGGDPVDVARRLGISEGESTALREWAWLLREDAP